MAHEPLDAEIKTRVPQRQKQALERIASERHLKVSDIIREAVREKLSDKSARESRKEAA